VLWTQFPYNVTNAPHSAPHPAQKRASSSLARPQDLQFLAMIPSACEWSELVARIVPGSREVGQARTTRDRRERRGQSGYVVSERRTLPRPSSMTAAAASAAAAPKAKVAPGPTALHSRPPMVLALKLATPVAV